MRTCIRKYFIFLFLIFLSLVSVGRVEAASLRFGTTTVSTNANQTFTTDVVVDAGTDQITSSDIWVVYDPAFLEAQTVTSGTFFPAVTNNITSGKVSITGLIVDPGTYKTGNGVIATVTFKGLKNGNTNVTFDCRTDVSNSSKIIKNDINATNIIACAQNGQLAVGIGVAASSSSTGGYVPVVNPTVPAYLPETGIAENIVKFAAPGLMLLLVGAMLRLVL